MNRTSQCHAAIAGLAATATERGPAFMMRGLRQPARFHDHRYAAFSQLIREWFRRPPSPRFTDGFDRPAAYRRACRATTRRVGYSRDVARQDCRRARSCCCTARRSHGDGLDARDCADSTKSARRSAFRISARRRAWRFSRPGATAARGDREALCGLGEGETPKGCANVSRFLALDGPKPRRSVTCFKQFESDIQHLLDGNRRQLSPDPH